MWTAIIGFLGPILLVILKEFLPAIARKLIGQWLEPPTPVEYASAKIDEAVAGSNISDLNYITATIIEESKQDYYSKEELNKMLEFANNENPK